MLLVFSLVVLVFLIGFFAKTALKLTLAAHDWNKLLCGAFDASSHTRERPFFDSVEETIGPHSNDAFQAIFDIIIERYVLAWYRNLSGSPDFPIQARMYLQYLSSSLIHRLRSIEHKEIFIERLVKLFFGHIEHLLSILQSSESTDTLLEDYVIRGFGSHLHIAMASRTTELAYLRALVSRLLPYVSLPPGLLPPVTTFQDDFDTIDLSTAKQTLLPVRWNSNKQIRRNNINRKSHTCSSANRMVSATSALFPLGANRAAYSLLVEILSTCVLLPAMDAVANPDFVNKIILQCLDDQSPLCISPPSQVTVVPVLDAYVQEWRKWLSEKSIGPLHLKDILQQQEEFHPFTQFMKSIRSTVALTTVILMNDVDQRIRSGSYSPDTCYEVRTQIRHILHLIRGSSSTHNFGREDENDNDETVGEDRNSCTFTSRRPSLNFRPLLFGLSNDFEHLLIDFLNKPPEIKSIVWLIHKTVWKDACNTVFTAVERRFLPLYIESPEYLSHVFSIAQRSFTPVTANHNSPQRTHSEGSSLFGIPLTTLFSTPTVEGRLIQNLEQDSTRPVVNLTDRSIKSAPRNIPLRDRATEALNAEPSRTLTGLSADSQHQLHTRYLLQSHQIDMSDWHVFIPGLCRPEVQPGRRLIDQLVPTVASPFFSHSARTSEYSTRPHDATFKAKIMNELNSLQSGHNRQPQLSSQFMYTVRTERIVNGSRYPVARVDRKYSEFYVLEQKLIEFHGNAIVRQLPKKQLVPRTFEYLESKREMFEDHLQYLISQPFLRNSELLHGFLTSKTTFSNNVLFELNLGRFAKSVPLKLAKEKGQFLDSFLVAFYISCNPQPISVEHVDLNPAEPVVTVLPSSGVGTLGGIDAMVNADHYVLGSTDTTAVEAASRPLNDHAQGNPNTSTSVVSLRPPGQKPLSLPAGMTSRNLKRTWLDNRLRAKAFWNNASLSVESRMELHNTPCTFMTINHLGLCELLFCVFKKLIHPRSNLPPTERTSTDLIPSQPSSPLSPGEPSPTDTFRGTSVSDPWDVNSSEWSEALLNGPLPPPFSGFGTNPLPRTLLEKTEFTSPQQLKEPEEIKPQSATSPSTVSITLADLVSTISQLFKLLSTHLVYRLRHLLLWTACLICKHFNVVISRWLTKRITNIVIDLLSDENLAYALQLLKATLFYPYTPSTESEKSQRKLQAHASLRRFLLDRPMTFVLNRDQLEHSFDQLFRCLQYPKWNKQLTYVLLDQLVTDLFPELQHNTRFT